MTIGNSRPTPDVGHAKIVGTNRSLRELLSVKIAARQTALAG
jgi:hypothetical protein